MTEDVARGLPGSPDAWAARDAWVDVVTGTAEAGAFAAARLAHGASAADRRRLVALLDAQRWRLAMFASDGWYWDDPSRPETRQVLRAAARAVRAVDEIAGTGLSDASSHDLGDAAVAGARNRRCDDLSPRAQRGGQPPPTDGPRKVNDPRRRPGVVDRKGAGRRAGAAPAVRRSGDADGIRRPMGVVREPGSRPRTRWR